MEYLTVKEVAQILKYHRNYVYTLIDMGIIPGVKIGTGKKGKILVPKREFENWLQKKREQLI